jgi:lipopolysaccharide/colanic/teichoic acid biosynthesis glycosyltransferase
MLVLSLATLGAGGGPHQARFARSGLRASGAGWSQRKVFRFLKFRTMHDRKKHDDILERLPLGDLTRRLLSPRGRPRNATAVGWALRKTTLSCHSSSTS